MKARYGVTVAHVKLDDTAKATATVLAEKIRRKGRGRIGRSRMDQRRELRRDETRRAAYAPGWADETAELALCRPRKHTDGGLTDFTIPPMDWRVPGAVPSSCSSTTRRARRRASCRIRSGSPGMGRGQSRALLLPAAAGLHRLFLPEAGADRARRRQGQAAETPVDEKDVATDAAPLFGLSRQADAAAMAKRQGLSSELCGHEAEARRRRTRHHLRLNPAEASSAIANGELPETIRSSSFPAARSAIRISSPFPTTQRQRPARFCLPISSSRPRRSFAAGPEYLGRSDCAFSCKTSGSRPVRFRAPGPRHCNAPSRRTRVRARRTAPGLDDTDRNRMDPALWRSQLGSAETPSLPSFWGFPSLPACRNDPAGLRLPAGARRLSRHACSFRRTRRPAAHSPSVLTGLAAGLLTTVAATAVVGTFVAGFAGTPLFARIQHLSLPCLPSRMLPPPLRWLSSSPRRASCSG